MASMNFSGPESHRISCYLSQTGIFIMPSFTVVWGFILFPLSSLILHIGFQRWRQNRRSTVSHTDFFTYNALVCNFLNFSGLLIYSVASLKSNIQQIFYAISVLIFAASSLYFFQVLTCVERYLAVVYPVVYLSFRKEKWMWGRNAIVAAGWTLALALTVVFLTVNVLSIYLIMSSTTASIITFCSVQVLRALRNPSPGEGHGVSQSKRKAFYTMIAILSVHMLWLTSAIGHNVLEQGSLLDPDLRCRLQKSACWFELPSSLVLPLLFLHRAGKLPKCRGRKSKNP